jgi:hypothetical protein
MQAVPSRFRLPSTALRICTGFIEFSLTVPART